MAIQPWKRVEPTVETKIDYRHVVVKTFEVPGKDKKLTFATYRREGFSAAGIIALTKDKKVILARQFRQGPEKVMDEIPGGDIDDGEEPEAAARRELLEETGYEPGRVEYLGVSSRDAYSNGKWHYFLATDCIISSKQAEPDEDELVEVRLVSISEFLKIAKENGLTDPAAVLMAYDKLKEFEANE